jgi:light-regulated signal transduction histidine kinase (bacteriophytochrome)
MAMSDKVSVLLIEDDQDDFVIVKDLLETASKEAFKIDWISTYEEGLKALIRSEHDVCLLDYGLGPVSGLELLKQAMERGSAVPVIFLTAHNELNLDLEAMRSGARDYLVKKEISAALIERSIRYCLEHARADAALRRAQDELERRVEARTSELSAANAAIRKEAERIKLFAYSVIHDLKSPAVGLHGVAELLHRNYGATLDERGRKYTDLILRSTEQLAEMIDKINVFISTKESPIFIQPVNLKEIIRIVREEFFTRMNGHRISWIEPNWLPEIRADRLSILRVYRNLVDNSLKYGGGALSRICLQYRETTLFHILSVSDDGAGLKTPDLEKLFGVFTRRDASCGIEGTGLGLAIVKEIAERHKGEVWAEPSEEGGVKVSISISKDL